jgi:predicted transcriptional regulator
MSRIKQVIDTLEAERNDVKKRLEWLEGQIKAFRDHAGDAIASAPSRASVRRTTARSRQSDTRARIVEYLAKHPGSTAGDIAKGLNLKRNSVSTRLTQMAKAGEIKKADRGYTAK